MNFKKISSIVNCRRWMLLTLALPLTTSAATRSSSNYQLGTETIDAGGRKTSSANYVIEASLGGFISTARVETPAQTLNAGYAGQLYEIVRVTVTSSPATVNENAACQLAASAQLDDASVLGLNPVEMTWQVVSGPVVSISDAGLATAGAVTSDTAASIAGSFLGRTGTVLLLVLHLNQNPIAGAETLERLATQGVKELIAVLLANDSDPDGDALVLTEVTSPTANGATVTRQGRWIIYTPPPGFTGADSFSYTLSDGHGGAANGTVTVNLKTDREQLSKYTIGNLGGGTFRMSFAGIPGRTYTIQYSDNLNPPNTVWTLLRTATADAHGVYEYDDSPPGGLPARFYRSVCP